MQAISEASCIWLKFQEPLCESIKREFGLPKKILDIIIENNFDCSDAYNGFNDKLLKVLAENGIHCKSQILKNHLGSIRSRLNVRRTQEAVDLYAEAVKESIGPPDTSGMPQSIISAK